MSQGKPTTVGEVPVGTRKRSVTIIVVVLLGLLAAAIFWPGYDAQDTPREDIDIWVLQTGATGGFARVNTALGEVETVKPASNLNGVAQVGSEAVVFTNGYRNFSLIDAAMPQDLSENADFTPGETPPETRNVQVAGDLILYQSEGGELSAATVSDPLSTVSINPNSKEKVEEGEEVPVFRTAAATINPDGVVVAVESLGAEGARVITADALTGRVKSDSTFDLSLGGAPQISYTNGKWAILNTDQGELWIEGVGEPVTIPLELTPALQPFGNGPIYVADTGGLWEVPDGGGEPTRTLEVTTGTRPATPSEIDGVTYAAWLDAGTTGGTLWSSAEGETTLSYGGLELSAETEPRILTNGSTAVLNDVKSGWVWALPEGRLVPSSQAWDVVEDVVEEVISVEAQEVTEPRPPVAEPDSFGVRAGSTVTLQVLLNDHDPNRDVLSIDPSSVEGLDADFGTVSLVNNQQQLAVSVSPQATGSATFSYRATDGTSADGLLSNSTTVTLTVVPEDASKAPQWCGVEECLAQWPSPTLAPGTSTTVQVLPGWVDPDGDPLYLKGVENPTGVGSAIANPDGTLTYHYPDTAAQEASTVPLEVTVSDTGGNETSKVMNFRVASSPDLTLDPVVAVGVVGKPLVVPLQDRVGGANGQVELREVVPVDATALDVQPSKSTLRFTAQGKQAGSFPVQVTIGDSASEVTQTARVVLVDPKDAQISTKPVTVFVRPGEDATVDILPTVSNPAGHVLLVSNLVATPEGEAELTANIVGERYLHATGRTSDGQPGVIGTATFHVSDGTGAPNSNATGTATFVLLPEVDLAAPVATDQWVTVAANSQIDVPVLNAAHAPIGAQLAIDPESVQSNQDVGLVFATPTHIRYLAPEEPGEYSVNYSIFRLGDPTLQDSAQLTFRVIPREEDLVPRPLPLEGRTLSGGSVAISLDTSVMQATGGFMELDAVTEQPKQGTAAISPEGDSIIYTARPDAVGQDSFIYQVRDLDGDTATSTVTIGISGNKASPAPVTFSDYLQMTVGADNAVSVYPTSNDIDPTGGVLTVLDVVPNAPAGSDEYSAGLERITSVDSETGEVKLTAGTELGTSSFVYTVRNEKGDTATGLIITKVIREQVPSTLVVQDTRLNAESLQALPGGVDVITNKVVWNAGSPAVLGVSLWGEAHPEYTVNGQLVSGPVPDQRTIVPFEVKGESYAGEETTTYAFLRIPTAKEVRLALRAGFAEVEVPEDESVTVSLSEAIAVPDGERLQVDTAGVQASGARTGATCSVDGTTLTYVAGPGGPWVDSCVIPARLEGQEGYTFLAMMVRVIPEEPQPALVDASVTVSPGQTSTFDLTQMVQWDGAPNWESLAFQISGGSDLFTTSLQGSRLTVTAADSATPTRQVPLVVSLQSHPDAAPSTLTLVVGPAPSLLPKGATVVQECVQSDGNGTCLIPVIGVSGEVNPIPGTPLKVVSVVGGQGCTGVTFSVGTAGTIAAAWGKDTPGTGNCQASFVVEDAQGRQTSGERNGSILFDLKGFPSPPQTVTWTAYTDTSVTLRVTSEGASYPPVTGYTWTSGTETGTCGIDGDCLIKGLTAGAKRTFEIRSQNVIGPSRSGASIEAWSYKAPDAPQSKGTAPVPTPDGVGKLVRIAVSVDASTKSLLVTGLESPVAVGAGRTAEFNVPVASNTEASSVTITPVSAHQPPPIAGGSEQGTALTLTGLRGIGKPTVSVKVTETSQGRVEAEAEVTDGNGADREDVELSIRKSGGEWVKVGYGSGYATFTVEPGEDITIQAKGVTVISGEDFGTSEFASKNLLAGIPAPDSGYTYEVLSEPSVSEDRKVYVWSQIKYQLPPLPSTSLQHRFSADRESSPTATDLAAVAPKPGKKLSALYVYNCTAQGRCSEPTAIEPVPQSPIPLSVEFKEEDGAACPTLDEESLKKDMAKIVYFDRLVPEVSSEDSRFVWHLPLPDGLKNGEDRFIERFCIPIPPAGGGSGG